MKIVKMLSNNKNRYYGVNPCNYITIHQTGNTRKGANARNHAKYMNSGSPATWHYTVDDKEVIQHFEDTVQCWHCGDGRGKGNTESIGIELCVNSDGDYIQTINNAVELVRYLMKIHSIPIERVVQHNKWSGKNCPAQIRSNYKGISWDEFIKRVKESDKHTSFDKLNSLDIDKIALDVIRGKYGNGAERKKKLGSIYDIVQKRVNEILKK